MMKEKERYNQQSITKLKSIDLIVETGIHICTAYWLGKKSKKREQLFKSFIQHHYHNPELHEKKIFQKLALHCVEHNFFDLLQYLVENPYLDKNINIGLAMNHHDLYSASYTQLKNEKDLTTCALLLALGTKNQEMYHYILDRTPLKKILNQVSIESFAWKMLQNLESVVFEENYYLNHFIRTLEKENLQEKTKQFITHFKTLTENYELTDCVEILKHERRVKNKPIKKIPKNYEQIAFFSDKMTSLLEKEKLESALLNNDGHTERKTKTKKI